MFKNRSVFKIFFLFLLFGKPLLSVIIPATGNTAVSVQPQATFPTGDSTNEMRGFGAFTNGFILADNLTTCSYTSFFPIEGSVEMRGGTVYLARDLTFAQTTTFVSSGVFYGAANNGQFSVFFPASENPIYIPSGTPGINGPNNLLNLITTQAQANPVNSVDWSSDSKFIGVGTNQPLIANNLIVLSFNGTTLTTKTSVTLSAACTSVQWHPTLPYLLMTQSTASPVRAVYLYDSVANTLTLKGNIVAALGTQGSAIAWSPNGNYFAGGNLVNLNDTYVNVSSFDTVTGGVTFLAQLAGTNPVQKNALSWDPSSGGNTYFATGSAVSPQLALFYFDGTNLTQPSSNVIGNTVSAVSFAPSGGYLAVGLSGGTDNIRIFQRTGTTLTDLTASHVGETANVLGAEWSPDGSSVTFSLAVNSGTEVRTYSFNQATNTLSLTGYATTTANVNATRWSPNGLYISTGEAGNNVRVYSAVGTTTGPLVFNSTKAVLNSDLILTTSVLFKGLCTVDGNGRLLDISNASSFKIDTGASVLLKNLTLNGVSNSIVNFTDSTGLLRLQDVTWIQNGDYSLTNGALQIGNSVLFTGTSTFIYSSSKTSTIQSNSTLTFDSGMTFSYAPPINSRNLLQMIDLSSQLYLLNSTLFSTSNGLQLTKGTVVFDGPCTLLSSTTVQNQGITLGDGVSSSNNVTVKVFPESGINIGSGYLVYNNI